MNRLLGLIGIHVNHFAPHRWKLFREHTTADQARRLLPRQVYNDLFKFAFVRNPWDLLVSYYHYLLRSTGHHRHRRVKRLGGFEDYVRYEARRGKFSQKQFLTDRRGNLLVDFVGRFESLATDFCYVCRVLGISAALPHVNRTPHQDYRSYYDKRTIELVAWHFREDIELFGYEFDGMRRSAAG